MQIISKIRTQTGDRCIRDRIDEAFRLIGGYDLPDSAQKVFGRIRGNDFTLEDAWEAVAIVERKADENLSLDAEQRLFADDDHQEAWSNGQRSIAALARRKASEFIDGLLVDLDEHGKAA